MCFFLYARAATRSVRSDSTATTFLGSRNSAREAVAAGADGLIVEVHPDPDRALSDGAQSLRPAQFQELMSQLRMIAPAVGRTI